MKIVAALDQDVEGAELDLMVMLAGVQGIEVGNSINAQHHINRFWLTLRAASTIHGYLPV